MRSVALRLTMNEAEADDAVQDAFLYAFRSLDGFEGRADLGTWLHRIVINAALTKLRRKGRNPETELDRLLPEFHETGVFASAQEPWEEPADGPAIRRELLERVHAHIERLPDNHRVPLVLRDLEELSFQEIADVLETSPGNARVRVHRARQALRTLLGPQVAELR
jgi:RNA polymerase sigma-70 factor (ECF subfamily)